MITYTEEELWHICQAMTKYGGSFVKTLSELTMRADAENKAKILATWPEYFTRYKGAFVKE